MTEPAASPVRNKRVNAPKYGNHGRSKRGQVGISHHNDLRLQPLLNGQKKLNEMANRTLPPTPGLIGIALVIRSKEGPRFVFNYPPQVKDSSRDQTRYGTELAPTTPLPSDDEEDDNKLEQEAYNGLYHDMENVSFNDRKKRHVNPWAGDDHFTEDGIHITPWEHIDAFDTSDLASILTPSKAFHKKCFELTLDPVAYVTYPIHMREDGTWKKPKRGKRRRRKKTSSELDDASRELESKNTNGQQHTASNGSLTSEEGSDAASMTMFNLVFIMHSPLPEASMRNQDIFEYIAKDMNKALKFAQHYNNYVWSQSEMILAMKDSARQDRLPLKTLWKSILSKSTLATAIKDVFDAVSNNEVATIRLTSSPPVRLSVQIPKTFFLSTPPTNHEKAIPGLWVTTANCLGEIAEGGEPILSQDFALLLMDDESKVIDEIQTDGGALAGPLLQYLKILSPTQSFYQTSVQHSLSLADIRILAQHLIYYRRAMAIPPLHGRDIYIMNPNSDNHKLPAASIDWAKKFPLEPPLINFLADLTKTLKAYKLFAPSKNHRPVYMSMLAWLMRGGWVTQLQTFAWIIVWPEIRYEVEYQLDKVKLKQAFEETAREGVEEAMLSAAAGDSPLTIEQTAEKARVQRARIKAKAEWEEFQRRPKPIVTDDPSVPDDAPFHVKRLHTLTIVNPAKPSTIESLYLDAISKRFRDPATSKAFMKYAKYFNGLMAIEMISSKEGVKRKEVAGLLSQFDEFLLMTRHW